jgi:acyl-coenzyme A synthetase/AMP-(fatty) acid ligase
VEQIVHRQFGFPVACFGRDDLLMIALESEESNVAAVAAMVRDTFGLPKDSIQIEAVKKLPRTERGKMDYQSLLAARVASPMVAAGQAVR